MKSQKALRKLLKAKQPALETWRLTFTDGTTVQHRFKLADHDLIFQQLRDKKGSVDTSDGRHYDFRDLIRFEWA